MSQPEEHKLRSASVELTTYTVNGVKYERLEDVPMEFRRLLEDRDNNGVPDVVDSIMADHRNSKNEALVELTSLRTDQHVVYDSVGGIGPLARRVLLRDRSRPAKINCSQCGYDLTGTAVGGKCPECGTDVATTILKLTEQPWWNHNALNAHDRDCKRGIKAAAWMIFALLASLVVVVTRCAR